MKKRYMTPEVQTMSVSLMTMIANSQAVTALGLGEETPITYGGVDDEGEIDPEARRASNWDDDEEDE